MIEINDSGDHLYDGIDPDNLQNRRPRSYAHPEASSLVDEWQELKSMSGAEKRHYIK